MSVEPYSLFRGGLAYAFRHTARFCRALSLARYGHGFSRVCSSIRKRPQAPSERQTIAMLARRSATKTGAFSPEGSGQSSFPRSVQNTSHCIPGFRQIPVRALPHTFPTGCLCRRTTRLVRRCCCHRSLSAGQLASIPSGRRCSLACI